MKHSTNDLLKVVYSYYPRGLMSDEPAYRESDQYRRLVVARKRAGTENESWRALLRRVGEQFPADNIHNDSLHLPMGGIDAAYSGKVFPRVSENGLTIRFLVSFLVPYYVVYCSQIVEDLVATEPAPDAIRFQVTAPWDDEADAPGTPKVEDWQPSKPTRKVVRFEFSADEERYTTHLANEIEATWGYQPLAPEIGNVVVPDVSTNLRMLGEATLYDCLMSDS